MSPLLLVTLLLAALVLTFLLPTFSRRPAPGRSASPCHCPAWRQEPGRTLLSAGQIDVCPRCGGAVPSTLAPSWRRMV